jgi:hypothetical protein
LRFFWKISQEEVRRRMMWIKRRSAKTLNFWKKVILLSEEIVARNKRNRRTNRKRYLERRSAHALNQTEAEKEEFRKKVKFSTTQIFRDQLSFLEIISFALTQSRM